MINIEEFSGDLDINYVQSEHDVKIVAAGSILDADSDENPVNVYGKSIYLQARNGKIGDVNSLDIETKL